MVSRRFSWSPRPWWAIGGLLSAAAFVALACGGGATAPAPAPAPAPQQPAKPVPAVPAAEPQAPVAPAAPAPRPAAPAAPSAPVAAQPKYGGSASFFVRADPRGGFEPHLPGGRRETRATIGVALETLAIWDIQEGQPCTDALRPLLAESWRYPDPTTLEIKLRQGVKFHNLPPVNGREFTAQDVLFSYNRMFDRGLQKPVKANIVSMEAVDKHTLRIKTKEPAPLMAGGELLAWREALILAKEAGGKDGSYDKRENNIGTGPFMLTEYTPGVGHVAKRNPDYWTKGRPYLDELRLPIMRDQSTRVAALQVGKLDFMEEIDVTEREQLVGRRANVQFVDCEAGSSYAIFTRNDLPPFNDIRVRRALSMAMDREGIVKGVFRGQGYVIGVVGVTANDALKPSDFPPEVRKYLQHNPTEAKRLLAEAGYPNGLDLEVLGTLEHGTIFKNMLEALPAVLRPGGFNVKLKTVELGRYQDATSNWNYGAAGVLKSSSRSPIETESLNNYHSREIPSRNRSAVKDPALDRLIEKMETTVDEVERQKITREIQIRMVDQAYFVQFPTFFDTFGLSKRLQGTIRINALIAGTTGYNRGLVFRDVWVTG